MANHRFTTEDLKNMQSRIERNRFIPVPPKKAEPVKPRGKKKHEEVQKDIYKDLIDKEKVKSFFAILTKSNIRIPETEYKFNSSRKWRFDYCWVHQKIALEVEGGVWTQGRHTRGSGFLKDMEKYNSAAMLGWRVVRVIPSELTSFKTIEMLQCLLKKS